jgi:hypothetical protein
MDTVHSFRSTRARTVYLIPLYSTGSPLRAARTSAHTIARNWLEKGKGLVFDGPGRRKRAPRYRSRRCWAVVAAAASQILLSPLASTRSWSPPRRNFPVRCGYSFPFFPCLAAVSRGVQSKPSGSRWKWPHARSEDLREVISAYQKCGRRRGEGSVGYRNQRLVWRNGCG